MRCFQSHDRLHILCVRAKFRTVTKNRNEYRKFGYLCGNIIYANYASSCEGA